MLVWLFCFAYRKSFQVCLLFSSQPSSARLAVSDRVLISESHFLHQTSESPGGAVFVDLSSVYVEIDSCLFVKCASNGVVQFGRECSGGAVCCRVSYCVLSLSNFAGCFGASSGTVIYASGDGTKTLTMRECSASKMSGNTGSSKGVAIMIDYLRNSISDVNISNPESVSQSMFFGQNSPLIVISKLCVVGENFECGVGLSSGASQTGLSSIIFLNIKASQGIFSIWNSAFTVSDVHVMKCEGTLAVVSNNGRLIVLNSWVGESIEVDTSVVTLSSGVYRLDSSIHIDNIIDFNINNICSIETSNYGKLLIIMMINSLHQ